MKIIHIGDIHLGATLDGIRRNAEIRNVFSFIVELVKKQGIQGALLAGDVFDSSSPSNESMDIYFSFIGAMHNAGCRQMAIIAGNHDNASFLEAQDKLMKYLDVHVIGRIDNEHPEKEVIPFGPKENPVAIICAVPHLREGDVRSFIPEGESDREQSAGFAEGVAEHYRKVYDIADNARGGRNIPIIGMGHLYATGGSFATKNDDATVGNMKAVNLSAMDRDFSYMALGHIHKPQTIDGHDNWRYAGSILPMNLQENMYATRVVIVDTEDTAHPQEIELPENCFHKMKVIKGGMEELRARLAELKAAGGEIWVKPIYTAEEMFANWTLELRSEMKDTQVRIVLPEVRLPAAEDPADESMEKGIPLSQLTPEQVFCEHLRRLESRGKYSGGNVTGEYVRMFREAAAPVSDGGSHDTQPADGVSDGAAGIMRFRTLYMKNINSLYGGHKIDFSSPDFRNGIFLICGNTGSGKSSILDAICLALYGATPRSSQGRNTGISISANNIMSEGTSELASELVFTIGKDEYRAIFRHKRTKKGQFPFAPPEHRLFCGNNEITGKATETKRRINELIGMDMEQFTRCVLLAQGSFDAFLKSNSGERSAILKKITGIRIFSDIGTEINKKYDAIKSELQFEERKLDGIKLADDSELQKITEDMSATDAALKKVTEDFEKCRTLESLFSTREELMAAVAESRLRMKEVSDAVQQAAPEEAELNKAVCALRCSPCMINFNAAKKAVAGTLAKLEQLEKQAPELSKSSEQAVCELLEADKALNNLNADAELKNDIFKRTRVIDTQIANFKQLQNEGGKVLAEIVSARRNAQKEYDQAKQKWEELKRQCEEDSNYIREHPDDGSLVHKSEIWKVRYDAILQARQSTVEVQRKKGIKEAALKNAVHKLNKSSERSLARQGEIHELEQCLASEQREMENILNGRTLQDLRNARMAAGKLEEFFSGKTRREDFLREGGPCPLCGSTVHPYCNNVNIPQNEEYSMLAKSLEQRLSDYENHRQRHEDASAKKREAELIAEHERADAENLQNEMRQLESDIGRYAEELDTINGQINSDENALIKAVEETLGIIWSDRSRLPLEIEQRIQLFAEKSRGAEKLAAGRQNFEKSESIFNSLESKLTEDQKKKSSEISELCEKLKAIAEERNSLFGNADVDVAEKALIAAIDRARSEKEQRKLRHTEAAAALSRNAIDLENGKKRLAELELEQQNAESALTAVMAENGFTTQEELEKASRPVERTRELEAKLSRLKAESQKAVATLEERTGNLQKIKKEIPDNAERQQNMDRLNELNREKNLLDEKLLNLKIFLSEDKKNRENYADARKKLLELTELNAKWSFLNDNFGTTVNTDRFGTIAQGYTLRELLYYANANRPAALKRHFTLVCSEDEPLELCVIDHYRGDKIRTVRNLSGGESFGISLALALGLAEMSAMSQNARLGNVMLDEGFGTLDEDSLDSALDMLMQLQSSNRKLVGIISHVQKLREKIDARIEVSSSGGIGSISGAGVTGSIDS